MDTDQTPGSATGQDGAADSGADSDSRAQESSPPSPAPHAALDKLAQLREQVTHARSVPLSASCVVNRGEILALVDAVRDELPGAIEQANQVVQASDAKVAEGQTEGGRLIAEARARAAELASETGVAKAADEHAARVKREAEAEAEALRIETDAFIDSRMASFESVLHKTSSQVKTARFRLSERSKLDAVSEAPELPPLE